MAIRTDGSLWARGYDSSSRDMEESWSYIHDDAMEFNTMAVRTDGTLWGWGESSLIGVGSAALEPVPFVLMEDVMLQATPLGLRIASG